VIPKSGHRFSERITHKQKAREGRRLDEKPSRFTGPVTAFSSPHGGATPDFY